MGLLDFLSGKIKCPHCGAEGARKSGEEIRCPNRHCIWFDPDLGESEAGAETTAPPAPRGNFAPARTITIEYSNHQGQRKMFTGDTDSAARNGNHISMRVGPSGIRISFSRDRIRNLREVESAFPQRVAEGQEWPTPRERQVMNYHKSRNSSSPLYERIRSKYPHW
jgi:hypothetical protein